MGETARPSFAHSRFAVERAERVFERLTQGREFIDDRTMDDFLSDLLAKEDMGRLMERIRGDPREQAQELAFEAMEENDKGRALARKALEIDTGCVDARMTEVRASVRNVNDRIDAYLRILRHARQDLGRELIVKNRGRLAGYVDAWPLLRDLSALAARLPGKRKKAVLCTPRRHFRNLSGLPAFCLRKEHDNF